MYLEPDPKQSDPKPVKKKSVFGTLLIGAFIWSLFFLIGEPASIAIAASLNEPGPLGLERVCFILLLIVTLVVVFQQNIGRHSGRWVLSIFLVFISYPLGIFIAIAMTVATDRVG